MELWVGITIAAAFFQNIRSTLQKHLKGALGTFGATFVRFGFGVPFAVTYWIILYFWSGEVLPGLKNAFWFWMTIAALAQIAATFLLLHVFSFRNFAVGTAYSRTEPAQTALFALVLFQERLSPAGVLSIVISICGVLLISVARTQITARSLLSSLGSRIAILGLSSGTLFGLAAVGFRQATFEVDHELFLMRAATTLLFAILLQSALMFGWIVFKNREEVANMAKAWKPALMVGFVGATASFGWFSAFTLQQAALVKVVAQVEMLFTFASSLFFFREHINRWEVIGCLLITLGIIVLVLAL